MEADLVLLNISRVRNLIVERELKQYWLAEQIGVDRKTVSRWMQGRVKYIKRTNALALAKLLECSPIEIIAEDEQSVYASPLDQREAADALINSEILERLGPIGEWDVIEKLLKASLVDDLSKATLGQIYNKLSIVSWRQSHIEKAEKYAEKAMSIGRQLEDRSVLLGAELNLANIASWRGRTGEAIEKYKFAVEQELFFDSPKQYGASLSNLGAILWEAGDLKFARHYQNRAIETLKLYGQPMNISIAYAQLSFIDNEQNFDESALKLAEASMEWALRGDYLRGIQMGRLVMADVRSRNGDTDEALRLANDAIAEFGRLDIHEGFNYEFLGRIQRQCGQQHEALHSLNHGVQLSRDFPLYKASLYRELAWTYHALGEISPAEQNFQKALLLWKKCEAPMREEVEQLRWSQRN